MQTLPKKRFGQHFLHDSNIIQKIIHVLAPQAEDHVVEIGPGLGALTKPLLQKLNSLHVIELDRDLIPRLEKDCALSGHLHIHQHDALRFDFSQLAKSDKPLRVVGNLPYNISTPLLFHLLTYADLISDMCFMLQKEVVDRITAQPNTHSYGRLSVMLQMYCETTALFDVPPSCFTPPPKVVSAVVYLKPLIQARYDIGTAAVLADLVKHAFSQRRKTLRNTLKPLIAASGFEACDIDPTHRAETLSIEQFARLSKHLSALKSLDNRDTNTKGI